MSAKIAVIIGDYSNGWSDAVMVQTFARFKTADTIKDRESTMAILNDALLGVVSRLEANEVVNPIPKDEPCCDLFKQHAGDILAKAQRCPFCSQEITAERREKYLTKESPQD